MKPASATVDDLAGAIVPLAGPVLTRPRIARDFADLTLRRLADLAGISRARLLRIEAGDVAANGAELASIASACGVSVCFLELPPLRVARCLAMHGGRRRSVFRLLHGALSDSCVVHLAHQAGDQLCRRSS